MSESSRPMPGRTASEPEMLSQWLDFHRATLELKCAGLTPAQLRERASAPSALSLLGLLRHLADVERHWFRRVFRGEEAPPHYYSFPDNPDGEFTDVDEADPDEALATWRKECEYARSIVADAESLDVTGTMTSNGPLAGQAVSLRWILVHMIEEYARHNGHADLLRERVDGVTGA